MPHTTTAAVRFALSVSLLWMLSLHAALHAQVPGAPQNLTAYQGNAQVSLSWTAPTGTVTGYNIYRSTSSGSEVQVATTTTAPTVAAPYADTGRVNGQVYYYEVTAVNSSGESAFSSEKSVTPNVYVDAGDPPPAYTDTGHHVYATDNGAITNSTLVTSTNSIANTSDPAIYQTQRAASNTANGTTFTYSLSGILPGSYVLSLYFADLQSTAAGQRKFNVSVNGARVLTGYDIFAAAGGANTARKETVPVVISSSGTLTLAFANTTPAVGAATIAAFILGPATPVADVPPPGWAAETVPTDDGTDADGAGPGSALGVSLPSGVEEISPGADIGAYNPVGPGVSYERMWRGNQAAAGYESPGLSAGWTDNYDLSVVKNGSTSTLTYPNGSTDTWTNSSGLLTTPQGAPYTATYNSGADTFTVQGKDRSVMTFTKFGTASGNYAANTYLLTQITNLVGHYIKINRDTGSSNGHRITSIVNDAATPLTLLSFSYNGSGLLSFVKDLAPPVAAQQSQVGYKFNTGGNLSNVSQISAATGTYGTDQWQYGYQTIGTVSSYVKTVKRSDPSMPGSLATASVLYDTKAHVVSHTDANKNQRLYGYGGSGVLVSVQDLNANLVEQWNQPFVPGKNTDGGLVDASGHRASVLYNTASAPFTASPSPYLPSVATNRNTQSTSLTYDTNSATGNGYGNVLTATTPRFTQMTYGYQYPTDFPLGQVVSMQESHLSSGLGSPADTSKQATTLDYYGTGNGVYNGLLHDIFSPQPDLTGGVITTSYVYTGTSTSSLGNVASVTAPGPGIGTSVTTTLNYTTDGTYSQTEAVGEPITVTDPNTHVTHLRYDGRGNVIRSIDASGYETDTFYNLADQVIAVVYPQTGSATSAFTYTTYQYIGGPVANVALYPEGTLSSQPSPTGAFPSFTGTPFRKTSYTYDAEGEVLTTTDLVGAVSTMTYDARGRVVKVFDGESHETDYTYTINGSLNQVRYPGHTGTGSGAYDVLTYAYDPNQNVMGETDGRGVVTTYALDSLDSLVDSISFGGAGGGALPSGITPIGTIGFQYDGYGRRTQLTDYSGSKTYVYDDLDEMTSRTTNFNDTSGSAVGPAAGQTLGFAHFDNGQRKSLALPGNVSNPLTLNSNTFSYTYYNNGLPKVMTCPWQTASSAPTVAEKITYLYQPNDWLQESYGGVHDAQYTYNARGFLKELFNSSQQLGLTGSNSVCDYTMSYDAAGNRTFMNANFFPQGSASDLTRSVTFSYDGRDQLTGDASSSSTSAANYSFGFMYDLAYNPTTFRNVSTGTVTSDNQLSSLGTFDGNGNPTTYQGSTFGFDPLDRLNSITSPSFAARYDGDGLRTVKNSTAGAFYYLNDEDGTPVLEEQQTATTATLFAVHAFGADGLRERYLANGIYYAYSYDPQGSTQTRTSNSATQTTTFNDEELYDAYGGFRYDQTPSGLVRAYTPDPIGFGGQWGYYTDTETHLLSLTHRYYDAGVGRFINRDPIGYNGGINLYGFAGNNPVMGTDPSGYAYEPIDFVLDAGAVVFDTGKLAYDRYHGASHAELASDGVALGLDAAGLLPLVPPGAGRAYAFAHGVVAVARASRSSVSGARIAAHAVQLAATVGSDGGFTRPQASIPTGTREDGWIHVEGVHINGTIPSHGANPPDMFPPGTTRDELLAVAKNVVKRGQRVSSNVNAYKQTFVMRAKVHGRTMRVGVTIRPNGQVITMHPATEY